jgi:hypothetical protein
LTESNMLLAAGALLVVLMITTALMIARTRRPAPVLWYTGRPTITNTAFTPPPAPVRRRKKTASAVQQNVQSDALSDTQRMRSVNNAINLTQTQAVRVQPSSPSTGVPMEQPNEQHTVPTSVPPNAPVSDDPLPPDMNPYANLFPPPDASEEAEMLRDLLGEDFFPFAGNAPDDGSKQAPNPDDPARSPS